MDSYGKLKLSWSVGYDGTQCHFVTDTILVYGCGNTLTFVKANGEHYRSIPSAGRGVAVLTTCHKTQVVAYAEATLKPRVFGVEYPGLQVKFTLEGGADLKYTDLSFSSDGKCLISLSGIPDMRLCVWDCSETTGQLLCSSEVGKGATGLSVNPLNWRQFFLIGNSSLSLWNVEKCSTEYKLTPVEIDLPEKDNEVGAKTEVTIQDSLHKSPAKSVRTEMTAASTMTLFTSPNMAEVYFKGSYEEYTRKRQPVNPKSVCWTAKQEAYVGCAGGQLIVVEPDTCSVTLLVNPLPAAEDDMVSANFSSSRLATKTFHSEMIEGSLGAMLLSPRGIFTAGKSGRLQCFSIPKLELIEEVQTGQAVQHLSWSPSCSMVAIGMEDGSLCTADTSAFSSSLVSVSAHRHSRLTGIDILCQGTEFCVTCRTDGYVQLWKIDECQLVSSIHLNTDQCTCVACPLSCKLAVVGTASGNLCVISFADPSKPCLVQRTLIHSEPVMGIRHDQSGFYMLSFSPNDPVFVHDSRPSAEFSTLGYLDVSGEILDLSLIPRKRNDGSNHAQVGILTSSEDGTRSLYYLELENSFLDEKPPQLFVDSTKKISQEVVQYKTVILPEPVSNVTLIPGDAAITFVKDGQKMTTFELTSTAELNQVNFSSYHYEGHDLEEIKTALSFHQSWFISVSNDGKLLLRLVDDPAKKLECIPHSYKTGGCSDVCFTRDSQKFLTIGDCGRITCWTIQFSRLGSQKSIGATGYFNNVMKSLESRQTSGNELLMTMPSIGIDSVSSNNKTWLALTKEEAHRAEDEQYSQTKAELRGKIDNLRNKVLDMIATNEQLPEMEKLGRQEFILDTDEHQKLLLEQKDQLEKVREDIEFSILASKYLREQIKQECWDKMMVKGKTVKAFQGTTEVSNYPMIARTKAQLDELERVKYLTQIDAVERKLRKEACQELGQTLQPLRHDQELYDDDDYLSDVKDKSPQENEEDQGDPAAILGSHRANYGVECDLLASQFELHSPVYKRHQIVLLEDCIYRLKENFNKEFDEVLRVKSNEIVRIREKNVRISKIISQLKLDDPLVQPSFNISEEPEKVLTVEDSEMTIEKYVSPEERQRLEEEAKLEEERRLAAMGDNPRERALDMMMGGRLEANVEEDLFKDMPRPDFMFKEQAEMTEDEIRMAREFEKKEVAFLEEREKMKKALEAELRKLQASIVQSMEQYDERIQKFFQLKINTQMTIHQEELKIHHLARALFIEKEIKLEEEELNNTLEEKKVKKVQLGSVMSNARRKLEEVKENYEMLVTEDRDMDKAFKKEFADCEPYVDQLYKLFKKRPRGHRLKLLETAEPVVPARAPSPASTNKTASSNKSVASPSIAAAGGTKVVETVMAELDHISHMPEGLDAPAWDRFVAHRHKKIESESKNKVVALELAEINAFLQKRQTEEDNIQQDIQNAFKELSKLQEDKMIFELNLEIQFLLKQGQVEVDMGEFIPDFSDSVLIHRSRIEELNSQIKTLGEAKINSMLECKDFKRGIRMLDWERQKMKLEGEGLLDQAKDIQLMRVTKDLLNRLMETDLLSKDARQKEVLDKTYQLNEKVMQKTLKDKYKVLKDLGKKIKGKQQENRDLDQGLKELQVSVAECTQLIDLAGVAPTEANRLRRMRDIVGRRRLVEHIKAQDSQYAELKVELERLRMKSFPALVQLD